MEEELLTQEEIKLIIEEAKDQKYSRPNLLHLGKKKTSIFRISPVTGLILINGNDWTGYQHIYKRHSSTSRIPYWNEEGKIGNPSKFHIGLAPLNFLAVADQIFQPENNNISKNKSPELFETYIGKAHVRNMPETEYTLIVYKETRIIHTMFVSANKKPFNKKKILDLRQGWTSGSNNLRFGIETFTIPYYDKKDIERFKAIIKIDRFNHKERWYIQMNDENGSPLITACIRVNEMISTLNTPSRIINLDFSDITWVEKLMKKMLDGEYEF